jgi:hypothetical protein
MPLPLPSSGWPIHGLAVAFAMIPARRLHGGNLARHLPHRPRW